MGATFLPRITYLVCKGSKMIENDKQLKITKRQLGRLKSNYTACLNSAPFGIPTIIHKAQLDGMKSMIDELEQQIEAYNENN